MAVMPLTAQTRRERETARLLASNLDKLNFGCGHYPLSGWTNVDNGDGLWYAAPTDGAGQSSVIALDIFEALEALPDQCASYIYSEHVFEHFTFHQGHEILRQWARILKPGGVVRIVTPDLEAETRLYLREIEPAPDHVIEAHRLRWLGDRCPLQPGERLTRAIVLNHGMWLDGHKFIYDLETIGQSLRLAGLDSITRLKFGQSPHTALRGIDKHDGGETGRSWVPAVALVVEATRPRDIDDAGSTHRISVPATPPTALERAGEEIASLRAERDALLASSNSLRRRLVECTAQRCAASGWRRIALYGAGRHTTSIVHEPWNAAGIQVVAVLDDSPKAAAIANVPIRRPAELPIDEIDAVIISSDAHEQAIFERAQSWFGPRRIPVVRIYACERGY